MLPPVRDNSDQRYQTHVSIKNLCLEKDKENAAFTLGNYFSDGLCPSAFEHKGPSDPLLINLREGLLLGNCKREELYDDNVSIWFDKCLCV